jgi:hypothetical protein
VAEIVALRRMPDTTAPASANIDFSTAAERVANVLCKFAQEFECLQEEHRRRTNLLLAATIKELGAPWPAVVPPDARPSVRMGDAVYLTPVSWHDITFTFFNEHTVRITTPAGAKNFGFEELQLDDRRDGTTDCRWQMLLRLARHDGILSRPPLSLEHRDDGGWSTWKKHIQALRKWLGLRFQLPEDPLPFSEGAYRAHFQIGLSGTCREEFMNARPLR